MGIPKFYRWLSERYPLINQPGGATVVPIIDNLYLDMNGIIHNCTHGNAQDVKLTEDEMIVRIFGYLDKLFHIVKPQKLLFMAIDGVAPRAKMNQQRSRRFKAAREAEEAAEAAIRRGDPLPDADSRFDSNGITPGTPFMARLGAHLRFFIRKKIAEDPAWQKPTIVFSGHDVPGEGEHKIMEYIRWAKKAPGYVPNTRHCLYGLDADLIMLSLVTHEPHFCLLREVVSFTGGNRGQPAREVLENPCQEHFVLLQIGLLRDYFNLEFSQLKLPFAFDLERVVDDFVLFCMMVGNDFLPALPTVDVNEGSLDALFALYKELLPKLGGYLTYAGELHRGRLEVLMKKIAEMEADVLEARATETEEFESKKSNKGRSTGGPAWASARVAAKATEEDQELDDDDAFALEMAAMELKKEGHELELLAAEDDAELEAEILPAKDAGPTMMSREARNMFLNGDKQSGLVSWKNRYYKEKMGVSTEEDRRCVTEAYIQGLHWVLEYYYRGVASWGWFYPYHYAPMASELVNLGAVQVAFDQGEPLRPYEQLLAVQPASSYRLLPQPYQHLMREPTSIIADFYPVDFRIDLEGKRADWEGVVLIPFIDEKRLLLASRSVPQGQLTAEERARNAPGDILVFKYDASAPHEPSHCETTMPSHFGSVLKSNSKLTVQGAPPPLPAGEKGFIPAFVNGTKVGTGGPPGFPSLRTLPISGGDLRKAGINVFGNSSRKESIIITIKDQFGGENCPTAEQVATAIVGQKAWVKWPYLQEAVVEAVSDAVGTARKKTGGEGLEVTKHTAAQVEEWMRNVQMMNQEHSSRQGIDLGQVALLLHVRPCEGLIRQIDGTVEKRFAKKEVTYPLQVTLRKNPSPDPRFQPDTVAASLVSWDLKEGSKAVFLGRSHYGCIATILPAASQGLTKKGQEIKAAGSKDFFKKTHRILVTPAPATAGQAAQAAKRMLNNITTTGIPSHVVAKKLGVSSRTLGRITSNVWLKIGEERRDKVDIGLCVKNAKGGFYVPDYAVPVVVQEGEQSYQYPRNNNNTRNGGGLQQQQPMEARAPGSVKGWNYSDAMYRLLEQYKQRFSFVWVALENEGEYRPELTLEDVFPGMDTESALAQVSALQKWLKAQPLARRPLVKLTSTVASDMAVKMLQSALPPYGRPLPEVELENVTSTLLLPPLERGGPAVALAGGSFELADRVVYVGGVGPAVFGSRGTVVAIHDDAIEVLFDVEFNGGTDLCGRCNGNYGGFVPAADLLNISRPHAIKAEGENAPRAVRRTAPVQQQQQQSYQQRVSGVPAGGSNPAQALAAASRGLAGPHNGSAQRLDQPTLPVTGSKGFGVDRNKSLAAAAPVVQQILNPKQPAPPPAAAGASLLAQLNAPRPPMVAPAAPAAAPPSPQQAGGALLAQLQQRPPMPMPPSPAGMQLLSQLQQAGPPQSPVMPPPGQHLLSQLQQGSPQPPAGNALLQQLQGGAPSPSGPPMPPAPSSGLLQSGESVGSSTIALNATASPAPVAPAVPASDVGKAQSMDAFGPNFSNNSRAASSY